MKRNTKAEAEFNRIRKQYRELKDQAEATKSSKLWHLESAIRGKLRALKAMDRDNLRNYRQVCENYAALLDEVSVRLLENYNRINRTDYEFEDVISDRRGAYLSAGIMSVLMTSHIPKVVTGEFNRLLPGNPKDGYPAARKMKRRFVLHLGDTNTGKTYDALTRLKSCGDGAYLSPLRILALENYERLNGEGVPCSLLTGEEEVKVEGARHISCTVEKADILKTYTIAVIDEIQMISDSQRGDAWTRAILGLRCGEIHLCGAMTAKEQLIRMIQDCGDELELIEYTRRVPLQTEKRCVRRGEAQPGDALVAFSRKGVLALSEYYSEKGMGCSVIYGDLPPEVRRLQYEAFLSGKNPILASTDAIGMGVNLPIRRIIFTEIRKFDGEEYRLLTSQEVKQIAGRAGRRGIYEVGYVACSDDDINFIEDRLNTEDEKIESAVVGPSEAILSIGALPLGEKLALWSEREEALGFYRKKDIRDYLLILDRLKPYRLPEATSWRLMTLPFDAGSDELMGQFISFVEERFVRKAGELTKPELMSTSLSSYEEYYQKINLYYSFSKSLHLDFDEQWVYESRKTVSVEINRIL